MAWGLIVEPNSACSSKYQVLMADLGLEPVCVQDGNAARTTLTSHDEAPAVVMTELSLTGVDGFQLVREVRRHSPKTRIIVLSSFVTLRTKALEQKDLLDIQGILAKSAPLESIRRMLYRVLGIQPPEPTASATLPGPLPMLASLESPSPSPASTASPVSASALTLARERTRLAQIASMQLVDEGPPDEVLQGLVQETARTFNVPIALVSLVLEDRQWFKAHVGLSGKLLEERGTEREAALCAHVVEADQAEPLVVPDAATHPVFSGNRLVREGLFRSYAGAPLITREGTVLGTLCILDQKPLAISAEQVDGLVALARRVAGELEFRAQLSKSQRALKLERSAHAASRLQADVLAAALNGLDDAVVLFDHRRIILFANESMALLAERNASELMGMDRHTFIRLLSSRFKDSLDFLRRILIPEEGPYVAREDFELKSSQRVLRWMSRPVAFADGHFGQLTTYRDVTNEVELARSRS
ncbi:GAF domain-containing protein [Cystobacter fuscus]|uniref:GAF domain-containing protein n=1 Tax=Cystobacter fuscus TaxID=43 RepID=UPI002B30FB39|nr:GAF domain-containing protein [Cystobacter fuscus]